jgi:two-component system chemotaxis response regulator CheB
MPGRDLVVIGASAGGFQPLGEILERLPERLPAAVVVVVHTRSSGGLLPQVLARRSGRMVAEATDLAPIEPGRIYVAPADRHVLIGPVGLRVVRGPRENGFRPAIDPLFRSAARRFGRRVVGVILSGALDDGSHGLGAIARRGGAAIVQDPEDAEVASMPLAALRQVPQADTLPAAGIADAIARHVGAAAAQEAPGTMARGGEMESSRETANTPVSEMEARFGPPTPISCPACGGSLWETAEGGVARYQCHVGHQYAPDSLLVDHGEAVEQALWSAVRILEQHAELRARMARRAEGAGLRRVAESFDEDSREYHRQASDVRRLVSGGDHRVSAEAADDARRRKARAR